MGDENTVNVHVSNLRSKLSKAGPGPMAVGPALYYVTRRFPL